MPEEQRRWLKIMEVQGGEERCTRPIGMSNLAHCRLEVCTSVLSFTSDAQFESLLSPTRCFYDCLLLLLVRVISNCVPAVTRSVCFSICKATGNFIFATWARKDHFEITLWTNMFAHRFRFPIWSAWKSEKCRFGDGQGLVGHFVCGYC